MDIAEAQGCAPCEALLAEGLLDEDGYYHALARAAGLPFLPRPHVHEDSAYPQSIMAGLAPLANDHAPLRFVQAPRGEQVARLLAAPPREAGLALTTPTALREAVLEAKGEEIAHDAAHGLSDEAPALSYRGQSTTNQRRTLCAFAVSFGFFVVVSPVAGVALGASTLGVLFLALACFRIAACLERASTRPLREAPRRAERDLPVYTIVVPLYREAEVAAHLCAALRDLDYPASRLDIKLMIEDDDLATRRALEALALPSGFEIIVAPDGKPRTKPRALNVALPMARGEYLVVYDAEDVPERDQLRLAVEAFARAEPDVCCLQARLSIDNAEDGFLPRCFAIEYAALFDVINPGLARLGLPIPLGGTSNHFRVDILRRIGGWDAWNVTEDADLGIRLSRAGCRVADLPSTTFEEAPRHYRIWRAQRERWMKGFLQTAITHSREPRRAIAQLGATAFVGAVALTLGSVLAAMLYPVFVLLFLIVAMSMGAAGLGIDELDFLPVQIDTERVPFFMIVMASIGFVTFCAGLLSMLLPPIVGLWRRRWFALYLHLPLMPIYYLLVSFAAWRGLVELIVAPCRWNKTQHGLSVARRRG